MTEDEVKAAFVSAYNKLVTEKKEIIANAELIRRTLCVTGALLEDEMSIVIEMTQSIVEENARVAQGQVEYQKRHNALVERYDKSKAWYDEVTAAISAKEAQSERLKNFIQTLRMQDGAIKEFDSALWGSMALYITVGKKKEITVTFRNGTEILV